MNTRTPVIYLVLACWLALSVWGCGSPPGATEQPETIAAVKSELTSGPVQINCGGPGVAPYVADADFSGGATRTRTNTIDLSAVTDPAPMAVYQSQRYNNMTYTLPGFAAGSTNTIRLHFADTHWTTPGSRIFNVSVNGAPVLTNFDIIATVGAGNKALAESFTLPASSAGQYVIQFTGVKDAATVSAIEVGSPPASTPTPWLAVLCTSSDYTTLGNSGSPNFTTMDANFYRQMFQRAPGTSGAHDPGGIEAYFAAQSGGVVDLSGTIVVGPYPIGYTDAASAVPNLHGRTPIQVGPNLTNHCGDSGACSNGAACSCPYVNGKVTCTPGACADGSTCKIGGCVDHPTAINACYSAAVKANPAININNYFGFIAILNGQYETGMTSDQFGVAVGGKVMNPALVDNAAPPSTFLHEMSHGYGLVHNFDSNGTEYGDGSDIMGNFSGAYPVTWGPGAGAGAFQGIDPMGPGIMMWWRWQLGWTPPARIHLSPAGGRGSLASETVTLVPRNHSEVAGPQVVWVPGAASTANPSLYTVEWVTADGFEQALGCGGTVSQGCVPQNQLIIHRVLYANPSLQPHETLQTPYLVVSPSGGVQAAPGNPFSDGNGVTIALTSINAGSPPTATITVTATSRRWWTPATGGDFRAANHESPVGLARTDGTSCGIYESPASRNDDAFEVCRTAGSNWTTTDWNKSYGGLPPTGSITAYIRNDGFNIYNWNASNGHLQEGSFGSGVHQILDLFGNSAPAPSTTACSDPASYARTDITGAVAYVGCDNHVHEFELLPGASHWTDADLSQKAGAPSGLGQPVGYVRADGKNAVAYYDGSDIWELAFTPGSGWTKTNMRAQAYGPTAHDTPHPYARPDGASDVLYRDLNDHIQELSVAPTKNQWTVTDLTNCSGAPWASTPPAPYVRGADGVSAILYVGGTDGHLYELEHVPFMTGACPWTFVDLTRSASGAPPLPYAADASIIPATGFVRADGTTEVLFQSQNHNIYGLVYSGSGNPPSWQVDSNTPNHDGDITPNGP